LERIERFDTLIDIGLTRAEPLDLLFKKSDAPKQLFIHCSERYYTLDQVV
jgi:hypothetical protein